MQWVYCVCFIISDQVFGHNLSPLYLFYATGRKECSD